MFSSGKSDGTGADDFELTLNSQKIDISSYKTLAYKDVMIGDPIAGKKGADQAEIAKYLSPITDVEAGSIQLNNGKNTLQYQRKGSYNMALSHIVFVFEDSAHEHHAGDAWQHDDNQHWHVCDAAGCPTPDAKMSAADHTWVASGEPVVNGTKATQTYACECGATKTATGGAYGTFLWSDAIQAGSSALDGTKFNKNATYNLKVFNVPAAGTYTISLMMMGSKDNAAKTINGTGQGFTVKANGVDGTILAADKAYSEVFGDDQEAWVSVAFIEVTLKAGENDIVLATNGGGYRVSVKADGNVVVAPKAA